MKQLRNCFRTTILRRPNPAVPNVPQQLLFRHASGVVVDRVAAGTVATVATAAGTVSTATGTAIAMGSDLFKQMIERAGPKQRVQAFRPTQHGLQHGVLVQCFDKVLDRDRGGVGRQPLFDAGKSNGTAVVRR